MKAMKTNEAKALGPRTQHFDWARSGLRYVP
jgi:hypothetical protein